MTGFACSVERSITGQPWRWRRQVDDGLGMDSLIDELLLARGVAREDLPRHRDPRIRDFLPDPSCFQDMDKGTKRLADAVQRGETIAIFGDYDVDGATSAALLVLLFRRLGAEPMVYIPDRLMEGYGPSGKALVELKARGASVAVCVDCGAQAFDALEEARTAGLDVVVVDHHQCASLLPVAYALINPNRLDEGGRELPTATSRRLEWPSCSASLSSASFASAASSTHWPNRSSSICWTSWRLALSPMSRG